MPKKFVAVKVETRISFRNTITGRFEKANARKKQKLTATYRGKKFSLVDKFTKDKREFLLNKIDDWFSKNFNKDDARIFKQKVEFDKRKLRFNVAKLDKKSFRIFKPKHRKGKTRYETYRKVGFYLNDIVKSEYLKTVLNVQQYGVNFSFINWFFGIRLHVIINGEKAIFPAYTPIFGEMDISIISVEKWVDKTFAALNGIWELLRESDPEVKIRKLVAQITLEK